MLTTEFTSVCLDDLGLTLGGFWFVLFLVVGLWLETTESVGLVGFLFGGLWLASWSDRLPTALLWLPEFGCMSEWVVFGWVGCSGVFWAGGMTVDWLGLAGPRSDWFAKC